MPKIQTHVQRQFACQNRIFTQCQRKFQPLCFQSSYGMSLELTDLIRSKAALLLAMISLCCTPWSLSAKKQSTKVSRVSLGLVLTQELVNSLIPAEDIEVITGCLSWIPSSSTLLLFCSLLWVLCCSGCFSTLAEFLQMKSHEMKNRETSCRVTDSSQGQLCLLIPALYRFCQFTWLQSE